MQNRPARHPFGCAKTTMTAIESDRDVERLRRLVRHSIDVIEANQAATGAYPASPSFGVYRYSWFRDGSFIADAMSRVGRGSGSEAFFRWCADVVLSRRAQVESLLRRAPDAIAPEEFLPCRYTLDGADSEEDWWEFQLDGYGTWLWALDQHARRTDAPLEPYREAAELTTRYLTAFWSVPCYDWWEEHATHRHTSTLAALHAGLTAAADWEMLGSSVREEARSAAAAIRSEVLRSGVVGGHLVKWLGGEALDASLVSCATPFRLLDPRDPVIRRTVGALESSGLAHGGVHRYAADTYFGGGEWLLLAALLGWHYAEVGRIDEAFAQLVWVADHAADNGDLPEQARGHLLAPASEQEWIDRWGPVATPLLWSHAMYLTLASALGLA